MMRCVGRSLLKLSLDGLEIVETPMEVYSAGVIENSSSLSVTALNNEVGL